MTKETVCESVKRHKNQSEAADVKHQHQGAVEEETVCSENPPFINAPRCSHMFSVCGTAAALPLIIIQ